MTEKALTMKLMEGLYGVCRLDKDEAIPEWVSQCSFYSVTKTLDELSVVCSQDNIPDKIKCERIGEY